MVMSPGVRFLLLRLEPKACAVAHELNLLGKLDDYSCNSPNVTASEGLHSTLLIYTLMGGGCHTIRTSFFPSPQRSKIGCPPSISTFFVTHFERFLNVWRRAKTAEHRGLEP